MIVAERSYVLMRAGTIFVDAYYDSELGDYRQLPQWNELEEQGKPIYLGLADERKTGRKRGWVVSRDLRGGPVYPNQNLLTGGNDNRDVTHEVLHKLAQALGYSNTFQREVLIHMGGRAPWKAGLQAIPMERGPWNSPGRSDYAMGLIQKAGGEIEVEFPHEIVFWWDDEK